MNDKLTRDSKFILSNLVETKSGQILTKQDTVIQIPAHFKEKKLLVLGDYIIALGICAFIMGNKYSTMSICGRFRTKPSKITQTKIDNVLYYEFHYTKGAVIIETNILLKDGEVIYPILDEIIINGKVPWYINYNDLGKILTTAKEYAGSNAMPVEEIGEILASIMARDPKDRSKPCRITGNVDNPEFIPIKSVYYTATNTVNKICGAYFNDGVVSALVTPTERVERVEQILRA